MATIAAPVVVGPNSGLAALLTGKVRSTSAPKTTSDYLKQLTGKNNTAASSSLGDLLTGLASNSTNTTPVSGNPDSANAAEYDQLGNASVGVTPAAKGKAVAAPGSLSFAAALKLAEKQAGPFDSAPYQQAISADENAAASQSKNATQQGKRAEADDAILYGRLGNYIRSIAAQGKNSNQRTTKEVTGDYNNLSDTIGKTFGQVNSQTNQELSRLGLAPSASDASQASLDYLQGRASSSKADARSDSQLNGQSFGNLMGQTKADVATTGTGKVADQKAALNTALENIASALASSTSGVHSQEAQAMAAQETQMRTLAGQLMTTAAQNNPNSIDNLIKQATLDKDYAEAKVEAGKVPGSTTTATAPTALDPAPGTKGYDNAIKYLAANAQAGIAGGGINSSHLGPLETMLQSIMGGQDPTGKSPIQFNSANQGQVLADADAYLKQANYIGASKTALDNALLMLLGKY